MAGLGWAMSLLHRGYKIVVRYAGEVVDGEGKLQRMHIV
jgi:hypothetical protein